MMKHRIKIALLLICSMGLGQSVLADSLDKVLDTSVQTGQKAQQSQDRIDQLSDDTQEKLATYRHVYKVVEDLKVYNKKLEIQIEKQNERLQQIKQSTEDATVVQRRIVPLVEKMIDDLAQFVQLDLPFYQQERAQRIDFLRKNLNRPDLSIAEKFRQVLEAYKIESEYGRKIDSYDSAIEIDGQQRDVTMLHVGRLALLYQTADLKHTGMWNAKTHSWQELNNGDYRDAVRQGIRMAKRQASVDILQVPVAAAEKQ